MTSMRIIFLGTGGGMPSKKRALPSVAVKFAGDVLLFDCGEGTQRQMMVAGVGFKRGFRIFVTHLHGDHVLGIPGLLYSMSMLDRDYSVEIYGPRGTEGVLEALIGTLHRDLGFEVKIIEVSPGLVAKTDEYSVYASRSDHGVESLAYRLQEKERPGKMRVDFLESIGLPRGPLWGRLQRGQQVTYKGMVIKPEEAVGSPRPGRSVVYTGDTKPCDSVVELARGADILIHDSTFDERLKDRAKEEGHSTSVQAASIAKQAKVKRLYLFHISPRYDEDPTPLLDQARRVFPMTELSYDLMQVDVPYPNYHEF